ncbi:Hypothetical_protein [Hexamita inflata]|uniref:Hypothetical_protein n=1 Tax=Hexamita inflata TaxID=28002 RepID=A0AA86PQF8_9EUKA|nr:Hypothetical protein HINF_LOCUS30613 [Hexamita inflata]
MQSKCNPNVIQNEIKILLLFDCCAAYQLPCYNVHTFSCKQINYDVSVVTRPPIQLKQPSFNDDLSECLVRSCFTLPTVRQAAPMFMFRAGFNRQAQLPREPELLLVTATVKIDPSVELCLPTGPLLFFILTNSQRLVLVCSAVQTQNCSKLSCSQLVSLRQNSSRPFGKNEYILKRRLPVGPDAAYIQSNLKNGPQIAPPPVSSVPLTPVGHQEIALVSSARRLQMELE